MTRVRAFKITNFIQRKQMFVGFIKKTKSIQILRLVKLLKSLREIQLTRLKYR